MEWISVKDRLPDNDASIITWNGVERSFDYFDKGKSENESLRAAVGIRFIKITHWMLSPPPPENKP